MRRFVMLPLLLAAALALAATGLADPGGGGKGKGKEKKHGNNRYTFTIVTPDNGSCGTPWANDTITRTYSVKDKGNGKFTLRRQDRGTFVTTGPVSPGKCDTTGKHGSAVAPGYTGKLVGYLTGTVTASSFNPNATCASPCTTDAFIAAFFSPGAQFSCFNNSADCKFNFNYTSKAKQASNLVKLKYRHWQDKGKGAGTLLKEEFHGDIANT
jgi:hypothetical protein